MFFGRNKKNKKTPNSNEDEQWNKDFKSSKSGEKKSYQQDLYKSKNNDSESIKRASGIKKGLSCNYEKISSDQVKILKKCKVESSASELIKISGRTNKTKFKQDILNPLIKCGFFELTIPDRPTSPNQKYRLTGFFIQKQT